MRKKIYIRAANQISIQQPLSECWMDEPIFYQVPYTRAIDPVFRDYLSPLDARRMGRILKRALITSLKTLKDSKIENPDAIITGTGLGCIENTEIFLDSLCNNGENLLKPTVFMQSTHNTISSLLAIETKSHGYNVTYSHKGISFDSALFDAFLQLSVGGLSSAMVGAHDEMTPSYFTLLERIGYVGGDMKGTCGEAAVSMMLVDEDVESLCELGATRIVYRPTDTKLSHTIDSVLSESGLSLSDIDAILVGINGNKSNDGCYEKICSQYFSSIPLLHYKHLFGECYSSSAFAVYVGAHCLKNGRVPSHLQYGELTLSSDRPKALLLVNHSDGKNISFTVLKSICGR